MNKEQIKNRVNDNYHKTLKKELTKIANSNIFTGFLKGTLSKETAKLGLLFFIKTNDDSYYYTPSIDKNDKFYKAFEDYDLSTLWNGKHYTLLEFLFGKEKAPYVKRSWETINEYMYQKDYDRRSFRRPNNKITTEVNQINFMLKLIYDQTQHNDFSITETIKYDNIIDSYSEIVPIWASAIDMGNEEVFNTMKSIVLGDAEKGTVSHNIIKALLYSNKKEAWELVGNLLLSAQRQEGLRQTILECLDETSKGAFEYILGLVIEHNLFRFSSVVRAIDVWAGFGWDSEKQSTIKKFITLAYKYFKAPELLDKEINNKDNAEVFMALWGQASHDIDKCYPYLKHLYEKGTIEKKTLVLYFINQTEITDWNAEFGSMAIHEDNQQLQYWASVLLNEGYPIKNNLPERYFELYNNFGDKDKIEFKGKVFSWLNFNLEKSFICENLINFVFINKKEEDKKRLLSMYEDMPLVNREQIIRKMLDGYTCYSFYSLEQFKDEKKTPTQEQRDFAFTLLKDRSEYARASALNILNYAQIKKEEIPLFEDLLTSKAAEFRKAILKMMTDRPTDEVFESAKRLLQSKNIDQRLAGLDLLTNLNKDKNNKTQVTNLATIYAERPRIGKKEQILLDTLLAEEQMVYNAENGFGLYNPNNKTPLKPIEKPTSGEYFEKANSKYLWYSKPITEIEKAIEHLSALIEKYRDYEYTDAWNDKVLLGNHFYKTREFKENDTPRERFESFPLSEVWDKWYKDSGLTSSDLEFYSFRANLNQDNKFSNTQNKIKTLFPEKKLKKYKYPAIVDEIIKILSDLYPYEKSNEFFIGLLKTSLLLIDPEDLNISIDNGERWWTHKISVFDTNYLSAIFNKVIRGHNDEIFDDLWNLLMFRYRHTPKDTDDNNCPNLEDFCKAYQKGLCTKDELFECIMLNPEHVQVLSINTEVEKHSYSLKEFEKYHKKYPFLKDIIDTIRERILEIELKRGESETSVTYLAPKLNSIYGIDYFIKILTALGKDKLNRSAYYWSTVNSKKEVFSRMLAKTYPLKKETQKTFNLKVKSANITEKRLIEVALFSRQWLPFISNYLGWKGFESGVWWLDAHTNQYSYAGKETEVARYSEIPMQRFGDGVVDIDWFIDTYKELGKKHWKELYDCAKYISDGNGHSRAKLYADVITGHIKIREVTKRVKDKRNQDYLRVYGLVPLSKTNPEKDLLNRYNYLLQFLKESKQFGSQRQESEALAVEIAMENLARTAGYADPIRLTWAMETEEAKTIINNAEILQFNDYTIELQVDELGKSHIISKRGDKELKSIPSKYNKEKAVVELKDFHKRLKNQYSRSRKSLEESMVRGDEFKINELMTLSQHPIISPMLLSLAFISGGNIGFYKEGKLVDEQGNIYELQEDIRIAHCTDFYKKGNWSALQSYCFDHKIVQPFKQIFRELYVPTADELQEKTRSRRYAGHQVQPQKTVALLKTRGWTVDYEEGLQRVYHKAGLIAKMYAMADWFSPADVESPTLETIEFFNRATYKNIPFEDINPLIFSEVMRDMDLVVSVAHVGGVDPETSHSTVEMRSAIIRETVRLFKLDNVIIKGHHAHIKGYFGEYSIHLGSAITHMKPGKYLSILPVHSQHRGRLFLPFVDEDPRSAELMSKILLLAKDKEIKDPTVLKQIQG